LSRYYLYNGKEYPSYTTILRSVMGADESLISWAAREVASAAEWLHGQRKSWDDASLRWLANAPSRARDAAAGRGTEVHAALELYAQASDEAERAYALTRLPMEVARPWSEWVEWSGFSPLLSEQAVISPELGYAGRLDIVAECRGERCLLDFKTGSTVRPEVFLQTAAYAVGLPCRAELSRKVKGAEVWTIAELLAEVPIAELYDVTHVGVVWVRPNSVRDIILELTPELTEAVAALCRLYRTKENLEWTIRSKLAHRASRSSGRSSASARNSDTTRSSAHHQARSRESR
jgi:hypothetical protein